MKRASLRKSQQKPAPRAGPPKPRTGPKPRPALCSAKALYAYDAQDADDDANGDLSDDDAADAATVPFGKARIRRAA